MFNEGEAWTSNCEKESKEDQFVLDELENENQQYDVPQLTLPKTPAKQIMP